MNPKDPNHPDLTAYVLGELPPDQEREAREWVARSPEAGEEVARTEQITDALHQGAPIPTAKLYPDQRMAVLSPAKAPRFVTPMMPRTPVARQRSKIVPFFAGFAKLAAAAAITIGAFMLGKHFSAPVSTDLAKAGAPIAAPVIEKPLPKEPLRSVPVSRMEGPMIAAQAVAPDQAKPQPVIDEPAKAPAIAQTQTPAAAPTAAPAEPKEVAAAAKPAAPPPHAVKAPAPLPVVTAVSEEGFTSITRNAVSRVSLRPHDTRPVPARLKGQMLAAPIKPSAPPQEAAPDRVRAPDLQIHSWKAEVASCPWNPSHKLLRVHIQLPADQPASASPDHEYPLQVSFDGISVRSYRLLSKSHHAPLEGSNSALHVLWYEVVLNANAPESARESGRIVATITLPNVRFTSQPVGPFDSSRLQALDRGLAWENARDDFLLETAIVGFGMLLRGENNIGSLDHDLVLSIAERAKGADPSGERARFIKLVRDAKQITGI